MNGQSFFKVFGTEGNDYAESVVNDLDSGYVIVGSTEGFGLDAMDGYFMKVDTGGVLQYARTFGGAEIDKFTDIKVIPTGFIVTGYSNSFGLDYDAYIVQTDANGILVWETTMGGSSWDFANAIALMPDGNYIIAGESYSFSNGASDGFIAKINTVGDTMWTKHFGGVKKDWFNDVAVNQYGEIALTGATTNSADETDYWVMKLDNAGAMLWEKQLGDTLNDEGLSIAYMGNGDVVVAGYNTFDNADNVTGFYYKLDSAGAILFEEGFYGPNPDYATGITTYPETDQCLISFSTSSYGNGHYDVFVSELANSMLPNYAKHYSFGTIKYEYANDIDTTFDKGVVVVGNTDNTQNGANSIFINKVDYTAAVIETPIEDEVLGIKKTAKAHLEVWPNPSSGIVAIDFSGDEFLKGEIVVFDAIGNKVFSKMIQTSSSLTLDLSMLTDGMYFIHYLNDSDSIITKVQILK